jgi:histone H3/H4
MKKIIAEIIQNICAAQGWDVRNIGDGVCAIIQEAAEEFLVLQFQKAILSMAHGGRVTLLKKDLDLVSRHGRGSAHVSHEKMSQDWTCGKAALEKGTG